MRSMRFTSRGGVVTAVLMALLTLGLTAPAASAAVRSWLPDPFPIPGNWHCADKSRKVYSCLINSNDGIEQVYKAVLVVTNDTPVGYQMSAPVVNIWSTPSPAQQIQGDACYASALSAGYTAACYGTAVKRSTVCATRPNAATITANVAVSFAGVRTTVVSPALAVNC
ncbi:hypothetical protein [Amycolatopsis sp. NPDC098790]|uniref:hypothetical protein n=1 Tax=Amycolatopsis sp. NPDC098790 TaxID=3363939 RepID=UPI003820E633